LEKFPEHTGYARDDMIDIPSESSFHQLIIFSEKIEYDKAYLGLGHK
jgi:hypothetical protein